MMGHDILQQFPKYKRQLVIGCFSYVALCLFGFCLYWTVPVVVLLNDPEKTPLSEPIDDITASWIGSVMMIGSMTGPYAGNLVTSKYGRRVCFLAGNICCLIAFALQSFFTVNVIVIYVQRILQGFGVTILCLNAFVYIAEISSAEIRGFLLGLSFFFTSIGGMVLVTLAPWLSFEQIGYLGLSISLLYTVIIWFLPESPLWLTLNGKQNASVLVMKRLNRQDVIVIEEKLNEKNCWKELFESKANRRALFITAPLFILQSLSGSFSITFFTTSIFEKANLVIRSDMATIITTVIGLVLSLLSSGLVEKAGRRIVLLISTFLSCLSLIILGAYFYLDNVNYSSIDKIRWLPLLCVLVFSQAYYFGFGIIPFTLMSEMFHKNVRSLGPALTIIPSMIVAFLTTTAYGYMITSIGIHTTFWLHSVANALAFVFTFAFVPETKGKTLEEIQVLLNC